MENTAKKIFVILFSFVILFNSINYVEAGTINIWCGNGATCTESNPESNGIKINCYTSVHSWSSTYTASGCLKTNSCSAYSGGTNQGNIHIFPSNSYCEGDPCPGQQKTGTLTVACKGDGGAPPSPSPPAPRCGDGSCQWTTPYKEGCEAGTHTDGSTITACSTDCRSCRETVYPSESTWCGTNCIGSNAAVTGKTYCGAGFGNPSGGYSWSGYYCTSTIAAGETCGTEPSCVGGAVCGDGNVGGSEGCDDSNTANCDGCKGDCSRADNVCGDGIVECGEGCDDNNNINGDGCSKTCTVESNYACTGNNPSVCSLDVAPGGCGDLNNDGTINFDDFFILADCVGLTNPGGNCGTLAFHRADWDDIGGVDAFKSGTRARSDFNKDLLVDYKDLTIFQSYFGKTGADLIADLDRNEKVDFDDFFLFADDWGIVASSDLTCFFYMFTKYYGKTGYICGEACPNKPRGSTCTNEWECNPGLNVKCSFGPTGKFDAEGKQLPAGTTGMCCAAGEYYDRENTKMCKAKEANLCSCPYSPSQAGFYTSACLNSNTLIACARAKIFGYGESEKRQIETRKR